MKETGVTDGFSLNQGLKGDLSTCLSGPDATTATVQQDVDCRDNAAQGMMSIPSFMLFEVVGFDI